MHVTVYKVPHCEAFFTLMAFGPKYSPQDPVLNTLNLYSSFNVRDTVSEPQLAILLLYIF